MRLIWAKLAVSRADTLAEVLSAVGRALSQQTRSSNDTAETAYRRLIRVSEALTKSLITADVPTGQGFGKALASLVMQAGGGKGTEAQKLREDAADTVLDLLIQILRLRFDLLFDSDLYRAVGSVRGWWRPAQPPKGVELKADRIAELAFAGLQVMARQGVFDKELREALVRRPGRERINAAGEILSQKDLSLSPRASHWLATGRDLAEAKSNDVVRELTDQASDDLLAHLLLAVSNDDGSPHALKIVADTIGVFEPAQANTVRVAASRLELTEQWAKALASKRQLSVFGTRGDIVTYDPLVHDSVSYKDFQARSESSPPESDASSTGGGGQFY